MSLWMTNSPCAACKCQRRKCTYECVFAPYFPADNPQKFSSVHRVFGASNVSKLLMECSVGEREDVVSSLAYEAECRLRDPVYGCVGLISALQHKLKVVQQELEAAKKELAAYLGPELSSQFNYQQFLEQEMMRSYELQQQQQQKEQLEGLNQMMAAAVPQPAVVVPYLITTPPPPTTDTVAPSDDTVAPSDIVAPS